MGTGVVANTDRLQGVRAVCVEDHPCVSSWVGEQVTSEGGTFIGAAADLEVVEGLISRERANLIIVDVFLPDGGDVFARAEEWVRMYPGLRIMFLSASMSSAHVASAVDAGALGYFTKTDDPNLIAQALAEVAAGRYAFGPRVLEAAPSLAKLQGKPAARRARVDVPIDNPLKDLTSREREVLRLIGQGMQRATIASHLHRSPKTIDKHRAAVMRKLDIHDRAELVLFAVRCGLVEA